LDELEPYRKWILLAVVLALFVAAPAILRILRAVWGFVLILITHIILVVILLTMFTCSQGATPAPIHSDTKVVTPNRLAA
jgi:membrane-associated phospholipid phosphatase